MTQTHPHNSFCPHHLKNEASEIMVFQKMFITHLLHSVLSLLNPIRPQQWITDLLSSVTQTRHQHDSKSCAGWWKHTPRSCPFRYASAGYLIRFKLALIMGRSLLPLSPPLSLGTCYVPQTVPLIFCLKPFPCLGYWLTFSTGQKLCLYSWSS